MLILLPVCRNLLSAIRGSFQVRNISVTVGSYMHVYLYGKRILILLICMLFRSCGGILLSKCLESLDHSKYRSVLQWPAGASFTKYYFFGSDSLKRPMWERITVTVLLGFFLTFLSISLNFKLGTYLFDRHFTWLIILFSKLTKNIFYFNKFFLSKFESNLTGSTFS